MPFRPLVLFTALAFGVGVSAQRTFVVDANGGGHFTDLPAAVTAAADGDTLLVRAGRYSGVTILGKGLRILGDLGVEVAGAGLRNAAFLVEEVPAGSEFVLAGVSAARSAQLLLAYRCDGGVHLSRVAVPAGAAESVSFGSCAKGSVHSSDLRASMNVIQSNVVLSQTTVVGTLTSEGTPLPAVGVFAQDGDGSLVAISHCAVTGLTGTRIGAPAVFVYSPVASRLSIAGTGTVMTAGGGAHVIVASIRALVHYSAAVTFVPSGSIPVFGGLAQPVLRPLSALRAVAPAPGQGDLTVDFEARPGDLLVAFASLPGVARAAPIHDGGWIWLDDQTVREFVTVPFSGTFQRRYPVPAEASLLGRAFTFQALSGTLTPVLDMVMGTACTVVVH